MKSLRDYVDEARKSNTAIGHFNISNIEGFWAVVHAAQEVSKKAGRSIPVIIGVSEGERDFIGVKQIRALVDTIVATGQPVFLNADHTYSFERVKEVIDARFDAVIFDGTQLSFEDNIAVTKQCVDYARQLSKAAGKDILVEAELGFIGKSSKVLDAIPEGVDLGEASLTSPEQAKAFIAATGADMLAPAVGNFHGIVKGGNAKKLNPPHIALIQSAVGIPLVLHGGSGNPDSAFVAAIDAGIAIVHVSTELRVAFRDALRDTLAKNPDEVAPYRYLKVAEDAMQAVVTAKLMVFNKI